MTIPPTPPASKVSRRVTTCNLRLKMKLCDEQELRDKILMRQSFELFARLWVLGESLCMSQAAVCQTLALDTCLLPHLAAK